MTDYLKYNFVPKYVEYIVNLYIELDSIEKQKVSKDYDDFARKFKVHNK